MAFHCRNRCRVPSFRRAATNGFCALVLAACCTSAGAQQEPRYTGPTADRASHLTRAFWVCDYVATMRGIDATPIAHCTAVTQALKEEMFDGDFSLLLAWWRENKQAQHEALARAER